MKPCFPTYVYARLTVALFPSYSSFVSSWTCFAYAAAPCREVPFTIESKNSPQIRLWTLRKQMTNYKVLLCLDPCITVRSAAPLRAFPGSLAVAISLPLRLRSSSLNPRPAIYHPHLIKHGRREYRKAQRHAAFVNWRLATQK